ncbi:TspO/MBR family protein [Mesonia aestuariivivens]|uniref:Tryptophan-rich sensory protein n=1 Tax=Mesonia aestuariivivens TaxID=2796128 RepID=A0ABS6VZG1_9FLAO|nr:TspO/MBR family protein [Mesonia aestuariivivens]MBW2960980.1 tryptophan-rich sensory protein [Mesonia aestuariivivens]
MNNKLNYFKVVVSTFICVLIGFLSTIAIQSVLHDWLAIINKPSFVVPDWIYSSLWLINFALIGIAAGIVWSRGLHHNWVKTALYHFGFQILLTAAWFLTFFEMKMLMVSFLLTVAIFTLLLFTFKWFKIVKPFAAYLLIPYMFWIAYTAVVNFEIWRLN